MESTSTNMLSNWIDWAQIVAVAIAGIGLLIFFFHLIRLLSISDKKAKYDYINKSEIKLLWYSSLFFITAILIYVNTISPEMENIWLFVRAFVSISFAIILGVIVQNYLKFYYPFYIEKRLKKLRFSPRINPNNGNKMKLLSEEEEDVHLDEGMQAEENIFSVDYDVWIDPATGYTKIEKYSGHLHALQCPECNYQTFKVKKEEIVSAPTTTTEGELIKFYKCAYCDHKAKKVFKIAKLEQEHATSNTHSVAGA